MARDNRKEFLRLLDKTYPGAAKAFKEAFSDVTSMAQITLIEGAIERRDFEEVFRLLNLRPETFSMLDRALLNAFYSGGVYQIAALPKRILTGSGSGPLIIRFNARTPRAEQWAREKTSALITEMIEGQRESVRIAIESGLSNGHSPRKTALSIAGRMNGKKRSGGIVGLHSTQAAYVANMREELSDPKAMNGYFSRKRRDKRFDATVSRAMSEERPLPPAMIDKITGRYADRLLALRGETIARTETIAALNAGRIEALEQLVERGGVRRSAVKLQWDATGDARTRPDHLAMDGDKVTLGEAFKFPGGGSAYFPGDGSLGAPAHQTVNCRCYVAPKIDWLMSRP